MIVAITARLSVLNECCHNDFLYFKAAIFDWRLLQCWPLLQRWLLLQRCSDLWVFEDAIKLRQRFGAINKWLRQRAIRHAQFVDTLANVHKLCLRTDNCPRRTQRHDWVEEGRSDGEKIGNDFGRRWNQRSQRREGFDETASNLQKIGDGSDACERV